MFQGSRTRGSIIISELMMDDDKTGPLPAAMMSLCMLIDTEGRNYTWREYTNWLQEAGFTTVERIPIESPGANGLLVANKPKGEGRARQSWSRDSCTRTWPYPNLPSNSGASCPNCLVAATNSASGLAVHGQTFTATKPRRTALPRGRRVSELLPNF
jgi:hypothetical protein